MNDVRSIKYHDSLLQQIADGLDCIGPETPLCYIEIDLYQDFERKLKAPLATMLNYLANDTYWNEEADWSEADTAIVTIS